MSVKILSKSETLQQNTETFENLRQGDFFTYEDKSGTHLCFVKNKLDNQNLSVVNVSSQEFVQLMQRMDFQNSNEIHEFQNERIYNLLEIKRFRNPSLDEIKSNILMKTLDDYYEKSKGLIWSSDASNGCEFVMIYYASNTNDIKFLFDFSNFSYSAHPICVVKQKNLH